MIKTLPITKAREEFPTLVDRASKLWDEYVITVNGVDKAVIMSYDQYESWKETMEIESDPDLVKAIKRGEEDFERGDFVTLEELKKELKKLKK